MDATVSWKGAVPFGSVAQSGRTDQETVSTIDSRALARGFDVRPFHSENMEAAQKGAIPYVSARD